MRPLLRLLLPPPAPRPRRLLRPFLRPVAVPILRPPPSPLLLSWDASPHLPLLSSTAGRLPHGVASPSCALAALPRAALLRPCPRASPPPASSPGRLCSPRAPRPRLDAVAARVGRAQAPSLPRPRRPRLGRTSPRSTRPRTVVLSASGSPWSSLGQRPTFASRSRSNSYFLGIFLFFFISK